MKTGATCDFVFFWPLLELVCQRRQLVGLVSYMKGDLRVEEIWFRGGLLEGLVFVFFLYVCAI
jgi:hypothetical protein